MVWNICPLLFHDSNCKSGPHGVFYTKAAENLITRLLGQPNVFLDWFPQSRRELYPCASGATGRFYVRGGESRPCYTGKGSMDQIYVGSRG